MASEMKTHKTKPDIPEAFPNSRIHWEKSKEQIWAKMEERMTAGPVPAVHRLGARSVYALAAVFILLVGLSVFVTAFTKNRTADSGDHVYVSLPDGSTVHLNAESKISFKPLLWRFKREVRLEGEAYFEVKPGKTFEVVSSDGITTVVGTSFNIYARNDAYEVVCVTGKVKVSAPGSDSSVLLVKGQKAEIRASGNPSLVDRADTLQTLSWMDHKISFTAVAAGRVFEEISRQYGVKIVIPADLDLIYTGNFDCRIPVENALQTICKPFNLQYALSTENEYIISKGP